MKGLNVLKNNGDDVKPPNTKLSPLKTNIDDNLPFEYSNIFNKYEERKGNLDLTNRDYLTGYENPETYLGGLGLEEVRAQSQSGWNKAGSGLGRIATKAGTEILKIPGVIGGIVGGTAGQISDLITGEDNTDFMETAFNNSWIKTLSELNEDINEEYLPVHVRKAVQDGNLWANITSIDFWATEGADGIGYIASMMFPGAALKALGVGNKLSKLPFLKGNVGAKQLDVVNATLANTILEAGAEAHHAMENFEKQLNFKLENGEITEDEYNSLLTQKSKLGRDMFLSNAVILLGPNALQAKMLWGKPLSKSASKVFDSDGKVLDAVKNPKWYQKAGNRVVDLVKGGAPEGLWEEGMQSAVEGMFTTSALEGELTNNFFKDFSLGELGDAYIDTLSSIDGQKAVFLGAFLGGGMKTISGARQDISDRKKATSLLNAINPAIQDYHKLLTTEIYDESGKIIPSKVKEKVEALQSLENIQSIYQDALDSQDKESLDTLRELAGIQLALNFINDEQDGLQFLEKYLNQSKELIEIQDASKNVEKNAIKVDDIITNIMENAKKMEKSKTDFDNFAYSLYNPTINDNILASNPELSRVALNTFKEKLSNNYISNNILKDIYTKRLNKINPQYNQILNEKLDQEEAEGRDRIKSPEQLQALIDSDIRLKNLHQENEDLKERIKQINDINNKFWDSKQIQKDFDTFVKDLKKEKKDTSEAEKKAEGLEEIFREVNSVNSLDELEKYVSITDPFIKAAYNVKKEALQEIENNRRNKNKLLAINPNSINRNILEENEFEVGDEVLNPQTKKNSVIQEIGDKFLILQDTETGDKTLIEINDAIITESSNEEEFEPSENDGFAEDVELENNTISLSNEKNDFKSPGIDNDDPNYRNYVMTPRDKKGDEVTFILNENSKLSEDSKKAIQIYKSGKDLDKHRDFLIRYLPIRFVYNNGEATSWSVFQGDRSNPILEGVRKFRENLIDALIQGNKLEDLVTFVANQEQGSFNGKKDNNGKPSQNNILEVDFIKNELEGKVENLTLFHVNNLGNFVKVSNNKKDLKVNSLFGKSLSKSIGNIFTIIKSPTGLNIPVKLNINTIQPGRATVIARIYKNILENQDLLKSAIKVLNLKTSSQEYSDLYKEIQDMLKGELDLLNKDNTTFEQLLNLFLHFSGRVPVETLTDPITKESFIRYKGESYYLNRKEDFDKFVSMLSNKRQNVITISNNVNPDINFTNHKYLQYLFDNKIISTDLETDPSENSFMMASKDGKKGSELWISSAISVKDSVSQKVSNVTQEDNSQQKADIEKGEIKKRISELKQKLEGDVKSELDLLYSKLRDAKTEYEKQSIERDIDKLGEPLTKREIREINTEIDSLNGQLESIDNFLANLQQTQSTQSVDQKADIERRRQEELEEYANDIVERVEDYEVINDNGDTLFVQVRYKKDGSKEVLTGTEKNNYGNVAKAGAVIGDTFYEDIYEKVTKTGERTGKEANLDGRENKINAKYDAELVRELYKEMKNGKIITEFTIEEQSILSNPNIFTQQLRDNVDAELAALEEPVNQSSSNEDGVNKIMQDFDVKLKEKIKKIPKGEDVVNDKLLIYSPENNTIIESNMEVRYSYEGIIIQNEVVSYDQYENLLKENIENNIRNIQKNSVSLQKEPKIENKVDIKGTPDNQIKQKEVNTLDKQLAKKEYEVLVTKIEALQNNIQKNNNPIIKSRLEKALTENIDKANEIASKHGFKKC